MSWAGGTDDIVEFWRACGHNKWFRADDALDTEIPARFLEAHEAAARGELDAWRESLTGALALVLLLDQFPRNMFRGQARAFATDGQARAVAAEAIALIRPGVLRSTAKPETRKGWALPRAMPKSPGGSAAIHTATACSGAQRLRRSRRFSTARDFARSVRGATSYGTGESTSWR
jgi:hypothetical protein